MWTSYLILLIVEHVVKPAASTTLVLKESVLAVNFPSATKARNVVEAPVSPLTLIRTTAECAVLPVLILYLHAVVVPA